MDHYPHFDHERAAILAAVVAQLTSAPKQYPPGGTPAQDTPAWPKTATRYGVEYCTACNFPASYCNCLPPEGAPESDSVKRELIARAMQRSGR